PAALNEIERQERLSEDVLRYLTIRVEAHEDGPSAMMRKSDRDRDDRGGRGRRGGDDVDGVDGGGSGSSGGGGKTQGFHPPRAAPPSSRPPPKPLPLRGRTPPEDRLQGREPPAALRPRAGKIRPEPHPRRFGEKAARARAGHQARALSRPAALRDPVTRRMRPPDACGRM